MNWEGWGASDNRDGDEKSRKWWNLCRNFSLNPFPSLSMPLPQLVPVSNAVSLSYDDRMFLAIRWRDQETFNLNGYQQPDDKKLPLHVRVSTQPLCID